MTSKKPDPFMQRTIFNLLHLRPNRPQDKRDPIKSQGYKSYAYSNKSGRATYSNDLRGNRRLFTQGIWIGR